MLKTLKTLMLACLPMLALAGCYNPNKRIVVGASSTPHALILEECKDYVKNHGYSLEIKVFNDYILPNYALENGELDANYFQHKPYLEEFNASNGTHLVPVLDVHFEPMGIYAGKRHSLDGLSSADNILVPSDISNYDRAMVLLSEPGPDNLTIAPAEAQNIPLMLSDCSLAVVNGNYALSAGFLNRCLVTEDKNSDIARQMANVIAVKSGKEEAEKTRVLADALKQENIKEFIKMRWKLHGVGEIGLKNAKLVTETPIKKEKASPPWRRLASRGGAKLALGAKAKKRLGAFSKTLVNADDMPDRHAAPWPSPRGWPLFPARTGNQFRTDSPRRLSPFGKTGGANKPPEKGKPYAKFAPNSNAI